MAIFATIFGVIGRFAGKLLTAALGWASTLLFGRVAQDKQILLVLMTFGSVIWFVLLAGVVVPDVATFLIGFITLPNFISDNLVRLVMLVAAIVVPLLIGTAAVFVQPKEKRPTGADLVKNILRGYPLAFVLALVLVFLAVVAVIRKVRALIKRWKDAHVPIVVREGGYEQMVGDLERAIDEAGLEVTPGDAPHILVLPARIVAAVAGSGVRSLVPERLVQLKSKDLEIQLHPSDIALAGQEALVNRARAALASRLASTSAFMTTSAEAQAVEERLQAIARRRMLDERGARDLRRLDDELAELEIPYEEWEVLYRMRLQIERDLLTGREPGAGPGEDAPAGQPVPAAARGRERPAAAIEYVAAAAAIALVVLDIALAVRDRGR